MQLRLFCVLLATALVCKMSVAANLYASDSVVVELTDDNFIRTVLQTDDVWLVEFYASWCGYSQRLTTEYTKVAKTMKGFVKVGALDAEKHVNIAKYYHINVYPTLMIFINKTHPAQLYGNQAIDIANGVIKAIKLKINTELKSKHRESSTLSQDRETSTSKAVFPKVGNIAPWGVLELSRGAMEVPSSTGEEPSSPQESSPLPQESWVLSLGSLPSSKNSSA